MKKIKACFSVIGLFFSGMVLAVEPCADDSFRAVDFWIGEWKVSNSEWGLVGNNHISVVAGGCALREEWKGKNGDEGTSLIFFDPAQKLWRQIWVVSNGQIDELSGNVTADGFVLTQQLSNDAGFRRIVLRKEGDNHLVQMAFKSLSEAGPWEKYFEAQYHRVSTK